MIARWNKILVSVFFVVLGVVLVDGQASGAAIPRPLSGSMVALGDSFSSGEGAGSYLAGTNCSGGIFSRCPAPNAAEPDYCHRSASAYPMLVSSSLGATSLDFRACSGAVVADLAAPVSIGGQGQWSEGPQLGRAFPESTHLVTLSIGGNDIGFGEVANQCVWYTVSRADANAGACNASITTADDRLSLLANGGTEEFAKSGDDVTGPTPCNACTPGATYTKGKLTKYVWDAPSLTSLYNSIAEMAPDAQIRVILYPQILVSPISTPYCKVASGLGDFVILGSSVSSLGALETNLNDTIRAAVAATGNPKIVAVDPTPYFSTVVDNQTVSASLCNEVVPGSHNFTRGAFINEIHASHKVESIHPNASGQAAMAKAVEGS
jgi:GDSL-like Lipase/Acylhydrolase family